MTSSRLSHWLGSTAGPAELPQADCDLIESRRELMVLGGIRRPPLITIQAAVQPALI